jgi:IclR family transcriptional regulator, acetate operon repressor
VPHPTAPAYQIASVGRALTLLSAFTDRRQLTVSEAAELLGAAPSTAHRMLQMLVLHGFVVQGENRSYRRGPAIESLRSADARLAEIRTLALPRLVELRDALPGGTPHVIALEGNGGRFVVGVQALGEVGLAISRVGWLLPAHTLAAGKALLACLSPDEVEALYPDGLPITRFGRITSIAQLHTVLRDVRARGYALSNEAHRNVCAVGVALPAAPGAEGLAISVGWPDDRFPRARAREAVRRIRRSASQLTELLA